ncbi:hypothetical protein FKP32DRAFT_1586735 [Trametes sanguinea]|nr:hypothetical protein FKP32DRAFT_1586735 [Trametes sanguinea]
MQFSTLAKLALVAAQLGAVFATPVAPSLQGPKADYLLESCTADADCDAGEVCFTGFDILPIGPILGFEGKCFPKGLIPIDLAKQ